MFSPDFINWLADFRLPEYELAQGRRPVRAALPRPVDHTTMWEIPALAILNELRSRQAMKGQGRFELDVLYARAKAKLWAKVERLRKLEGSAPVGLRHAPPPRLPVAALVRRGAEGRPGPVLHRHLQRAAGDGQRSRSDRHQRARAADGRRRARQ